MTIGFLITEYRKENNISARAFASKCGLSFSYITMLEKNKDGRGNPIKPSLETVQKVANVIGMDYQELLSVISDEPTKPDNSSDKLQTLLRHISKMTDEEINVLLSLSEYIISNKEVK